MAAQGNLVLANGEASPVNKTFTPNGVIKAPDGSQLASYEDKTGGIAIGFPAISVSVRRSSVKTDVDKRITLPTLEVISGSDGGYTPSPKIAYSHFAREQFVLPARGTTAERKNLLAFSKNLNADAVMTNAVWNLEPVW
jgi:hypothetical protein